MASARSLVVVRPVGSVEGDGPDAIAARMEAAVVANDYEKALAEYETLPEAGKELPPILPRGFAPARPPTRY
ncbi:hypothetical protein [Nitratireductor aquibiodomus]|nr:hypothetical protein [Nitratireductor aquibiodomus]